MTTTKIDQQWWASTNEESFSSGPYDSKEKAIEDYPVEYDLKDRVKVIASGKLITPPEVVWALCVGADFVTSARGFMFSLGCIQALQCNKDTCPTGITTHNRRLQRGLVVTEKGQRVASYVRNVLNGVHLISHSCGVREPRELSRAHCRVVLPDGRSQPLDEIFPVQESEGPFLGVIADVDGRALDQRK